MLVLEPILLCMAFYISVVFGQYCDRCGRLFRVTNRGFRSDVQPVHGVSYIFRWRARMECCPVRSATSVDPRWNSPRWYVNEGVQLNLAVRIRIRTPLSVVGRAVWTVGVDRELMLLVRHFADLNPSLYRSLNQFHDEHPRSAGSTERTHTRNPPPPHDARRSLPPIRHPLVCMDQPTS
jgi:hypothetical protein